MTPVGGRKQTRRRMRKKWNSGEFVRAFVAEVFGATYAEHMRYLGYWKANGPRKPLGGRNDRGHEVTTWGRVPGK